MPIIDQEYRVIATTWTVSSDATAAPGMPAYGIFTTSGGMAMTGLARFRCPWHAEKTGSCCVDYDRATYHCFGCGKSGPLAEFEAAREPQMLVDVMRNSLRLAKINAELLGDVPEIVASIEAMIVRADQLQITMK